ncbi:serine hydrolase [Rubrivirga sp. IMCC43871]|uniref:serine hydrolase domain-containing protein n=1 Tax=Rubrivirga sp. IMCC43871 TaxID=3391575 RepID=UPI00398FF23F
MRSLLALVLLLVFPARATDTPTPAVNVGATESVPTAPARCEVTIEGHHGGLAGEIRYRADQSQVRTRVGWWASLSTGGDEAWLTLRPGQSFSEAYDLRLGCDARRRYRFVFTYGDTEYTHVFPSEDGYTQDRVIDLGAVSRFFGIAPGEDLEPQPVALEGLDLDGEWTRRESNNDPNDGMRIRIEGDHATITSVPETAGSAWREGGTLWRDIEPGGALRALGSNSRYYPAELTPTGADRLTLSIRHGGAGNDQTWVRSTGCWDANAVIQSGLHAPDIWVRFSTDLPSGFQSALRAARDAGAAIQTVALTPSDEWVVVAANTPCYSAGFPEDAREWIDRYVGAGNEIDVVAFGPGGRWLVVAEDLLRHTTNVSDGISAAIRRAQENGLRVTSVAFSPVPDERWALSAGGQATTGPARLALSNAVRAAGEGERPVHEIAVGPNDEWAMVAEDWFVTRDVPAGLREMLERYRTDERRRIDHVVLHEVDGQTRWAILSNGPEPPPAPTDLVNLFEQRITSDSTKMATGVPGDSTIYQKMKEHRITGLAVAVVQNNRVAWTRSYGLRRAQYPEEYVYPTTIFDAASLSKPVSYAAALQLVDAGAIGLTDPGVLYDLAGNDLPSRRDLDGIRAGEIHLAHLLNHCAGIQNEKGASGAQAIVPGGPMPTIRQIFRGKGPAASGNAIVRVDTLEVGEAFDYSGANSILVQALMDQHASGGYDGQVQRLLDGLGMSRSTFRRDFHERIPEGSLAFGHLIAGDGEVLTMRHQAYPNQAAAGLRATASDLARYIILLNQGGVYDGERLLEATTVDRFLGRDGVGAATGVAEAACGGRRSMRLGIYSAGLDTENERYWHGGLHGGFRTYLRGLPRQQGGVVILITGTLDDANAMRDEIRAALRAAYGWRSL